uniref:Putative ovule protein n=1 Tax=Solanum chacoense TaxID=4108 RepID=A0A0V0I1K4_SOLCH
MIFLLRPAQQESSCLISAITTGKLLSPTPPLSSPLFSLLPLSCSPPLRPANNTNSSSNCSDQCHQQL